MSDSARSEPCSRPADPANQADTASAAQPEFRFFADIMLGSLARWLRILGYDTAYDNTIEDEELVRRCREEGRIALTRDRRLVRHRSLLRAILVRSDRLGHQVRQVLDEIGEQPAPERLFRRCLHCNLPLRPADPAAVAGSVPPYILETQPRFLSCPACGRVYWAGTHRARVLQRLREWWPEGPDPAGSGR
jgi:hypothetical protein